MSDVVFKDSTRPVYANKPPVAPWGFKAHSAPLGFEFLTNFNDPLLNNSFIVALHGSTSVWRQRGNAVVQMIPNGKYTEIVTGFYREKRKINDLAVLAMLFSGITILFLSVTIRMG